MAVNLSPVGGVAGQFFDNNGVPLSGGKIYTYAAGSSTPAATYTSATGGTAHTNPIVLDSGGRVPSGEIWLTDGIQYKFVIKTSADVLIGTYDNVYVGASANAVAYTPGVNSLLSDTTVQGALDSLSNSSTGAEKIGFLQEGAGAVPTDAQAKLRQTVSVKDFGAVGDGVTDDTAAIQAAVNSGAELIYGISTDTYLVSSALIPSNIELDFKNATVKAKTASLDVFRNSNYASGSNTNITIKNVKINGNKASIASVRGIAFQYIDGLTLSNVELYNCGGNGIYIGTTSANVTLQNCTVTACGDDGTDSFTAANINILGGTADYPNTIRVQNVSVTNCKSTQAWGIGLIAQFVDNYFVNGGEYSSNGRGLSLPTINGNGVGGGQIFSGKFVGISSHNNAESGFDIASKSKQIGIIGNSSFDNGLTGIFAGHTNGDGYSIIGNSVATNAGMGIWVTDTARSVVISGNYVQANGSRGIFVESTQYVVVSDNIVKDHLSGFGNGIMMSDLAGIVDGGVIVGNLLVNNVSNIYNPYNTIIQDNNYNDAGKVVTTYTSTNFDPKIQDVVVSSGAGSIHALPNPTKFTQGISFKFVNTSAGGLNITTATNGIWVAGTSVTTDILVSHAVAEYLCCEMSSGVFQWVRN